MKLIYLSFLLAFAVACGNPTEKGGKGQPTLATCGDGVVSAGETCDSAIAAGDGACPTECTNTAGCSIATLQGSAEACTATCAVAVVETCVDNDGCCPATCDSGTDSDCSITCGDGVVDEGETCDGDCETCDSTDACVTVVPSGSAQNCSLECLSSRITACKNDDGCCPTGCDDDSDNDCSNTCGDGIVVAGEVCDGNCPTSCDDNNACTIDNVSGSPDLCNVVCINQPITTCQDSDGCCAPGCTSANDNDCTCVPTTCAAAGKTCGQIPNGCGAMLTCGMCNAGDTCQNGTCVNTPISPTGGTCADNAGCADICLLNNDFQSGFCSTTCTDDFGCAPGSHCFKMTGYADKFCAPNCQADNDCRGGAYGCYDHDYDGTKECAPRPTGTSPVGGACTGLPDCSPSMELCVEATGFPGGYCTQTCIFNGTCPFGSVCMTDHGFCAPTCNNASECRTGYQCQIVTNDVTGETQGVCLNP